MEEILSKSENMSTEYCATVVRVGEVKPIENSDFLGVTMVEGREIVVRKDDVHEGDVVVYVSNESQINFDFLSFCNEFQDESLNRNYEEIQMAVGEMKTNGATDEEIREFVSAHRGYFDKHGRVKMKKLRGVYSMGYLINPVRITNWKLLSWNENQWAEHVGEDFDTIKGELFVQAYVPKIKEPRVKGKGRAEKRIKRFNRMIPGQFSFHYDTEQLQRNMERLHPDTSVCISVKMHGTSFICGNVKVRNPKWGGLYARLFNYLPTWLQFTKDEYDTVYSSRKVIKNSDLNPGVTAGFYDVDIWGEYYPVLKGILPHGMTIYGEIVGYVTGSSITGIQSIGGKVCDYGCKPCFNKLMIYRVKHVLEDNVIEYNVTDVYNYTVNNLIPALKQLDIQNGTHWAERIVPIPILYNGTMKDLYPDVDTENHWHENVLELMKNDARFGMEQDEPLCKNKVPREGIVLRINDDPIAEAFKLKCLKFLGKEAEDIDKGRTSDIEMQERYEDV